MSTSHAAGRSLSGGYGNGSAIEAGSWTVASGIEIGGWFESPMMRVSETGWSAPRVRNGMGACESSCAGGQRSGSRGEDEGQRECLSR